MDGARSVGGTSLGRRDLHDTVGNIAPISSSAGESVAAHAVECRNATVFVANGEPVPVSGSPWFSVNGDDGDEKILRSLRRRNLEMSLRSG